MSSGYCLCGAVDCPRCGPAQGYHVHRRWCYGADGRVDCGEVADGDAPGEDAEEGADE